MAEKLTLESSTRTHSPKGKVLAFLGALGLTGILAGCGGGSGNSPSVPRAYRITSLQADINPQPYQIATPLSINNSGQVLLNVDNPGPPPSAASARLARKPKAIDAVAGYYLWQNNTLGALPTDDDAQYQAINDSGQITATLTDLSSGASQAAIYQSGAFTDLGTPAATHAAFPSGINRQGDVTGFLGADQGSFLWKSGSFTNLGTVPSTNFVQAEAINDADQIIGEIFENSAYTRPFFWQHGTFTQIGTLPGQPRTVANGLNNAGDVVGYSGTRAFRWRQGAMTDLGTLPGAYSSEASDVNDSGLIVGSSLSANPATTATEVQRAVLWQNGRIIDLNTLIPTDSGWVLSSALHVNNRGQIVGQGNKGAFLLTPE